jgi:predicted O-methyltransferase YrrM
MQIGSLGAHRNLGLAMLTMASVSAAVVVSLFSGLLEGLVVGLALLLVTFSVNRYAVGLGQSMAVLERQLGQLEIELGRNRHGLTALESAVASAAQRGLERLENAEVEVAEILRHSNELVLERVALLREDIEAHRQLTLRLDKNQNARGRNSLRQVEGMFALYESLLPTLPLPPLGGWALSADVLSFLVYHVLASNPEVIVELGSGASTSVLALALEKNGSGRLVSVEHDPVYLELTRNGLRARGLEHRVDLVHAPLREMTTDGETGLWYEIPAGAIPSKVDLVIVDGPPATEHSTRFPALPRLAAQLRAGGMLVLDDAKRDGEASIAIRWLEGHPEFSMTVNSDHEKGTALFEKRAL